VFDLSDGASDEDVRAAVARLREPAVTVGEFNLVVGFGSTLRDGLRPAPHAPSSMRSGRSKDLTANRAIPTVMG
jgi:hypothetical protein